MPLKHIRRYKAGFMPVVEAEEGEYLLGGQGVYDGAVFDGFFDALHCMSEMMQENLSANRRVKLGKVVPFRGLVSPFLYVPH